MGIRMQANQVRGVTMYDRVTDRLRDEIMSGRLPPNTRLKAPELALRLGVSQSPVREALQKLQVEGLIVLKPNHGAVVRGLGRDEFMHLMRLRAAIEGMQAGLCAARHSTALLAKIEQSAERFATAVATGDRDRRMKANATFHQLILTSDGGQTALEIVDRVNAITAALRRQYVHSAERLERGVIEHAEIVAAIRARDEVAAERLARAHVMITLDDILINFQPEPADRIV
jgi:GntR family transcriptional regulator, rspAB operon transcriptional repressor